MRHLLSLWSFAILIAFPASTLAQTVDSIMQRLITVKSESLAGCDAVQINKSVMGINSVEYFEKIHIPGIDGKPVAALRQVPMVELQQRQAPEGGLGDATPEQLEAAADMLDQQSAVVGDAFDKELQSVGMPKGLQALIMNPPPDEPWLSPNMGDMFGNYAMMFRAAAKGKRAADGRDGIAHAKANVSNMAQIATMARIVGRETVDGKEAFHVRVDELNHTERSDGQEITMQTISIWIDTDKYVPLRMKMDGVVTDGKESRPITIEKHDTDFRTVPGSSMYEPYRSVMRIAGVMNAKEQAEMQQAQQQMAEFEQQMQQMPPSQKQMIMARMGPQMEMMKKMASGGGMEVETIVHEIQCNPDALPGQLAMATTMMGGMAASTPFPGVPVGASVSGVVPDAPVDSVPVVGVPIGGEPQVAVRPYYIDEEGIGVLRYRQPPGPAGQYFLVIMGLTNNAERPREVLVGQMGPYKGPHVAIYIGDLNMMNIPLEQIEIELYQDNPYRPAVRFRPEVNPEKAEGMEDCGKMSVIGSCSKTRPANSL